MTTIDSTQSLYSVYSSISTASTESDSTQSFLDMMNAAAQKEAEKKKTDREKESEKTAEEAKTFFDNMKKAGNALNYVIQSNMDKIKELIEKRKEELLKAGGYYNEPPLSAEQKTELLKSVEKELAEYTKQLMKDLEDKSKVEKAAKQDQKTVSLADLLG